MAVPRSSDHAVDEEFVPDELIAMPAAAAARFAGVNERRLRYWDEAGLLTPGIKRQLSPRNTVRLYEFPELVELRVIAALENLGISIRRTRKVVRFLREEGHEAPLRELRFAVAGKEIFFQRPDGTWAGDRNPEQYVFEATITLPLEQYRAVVRQAARAGRGRAELGRIDRHRKVLGHKPVFAGTRVPVSAVLPYLRRGLPTEDILAAFPQLTEADIEVARAEVDVAS
jgi:uncharacterized protein (DUF433 family)